MRILQLDNIHYTLERQLIEIESVTYIIVRGNGLRIVVDHDRPETIASDGIQRLHATPVKLNRRTDSVCPGPQHDNRLVVTRIMYIVLGPTISQIQIIGLRGELSGKRVYLLHHRQYTHLFAVLAHPQDRLVHAHLFSQPHCTGNLEIRESQLLGAQQQIVLQVLQTA